MYIIRYVPRGWMKVSKAAKAARVTLAMAKTLIVAGTVPVAIDPAGYMWVEPGCLRNGQIREH